MYHMNMYLPTHKKTYLEFAIWGASCYLPHCSVRQANVVHLVLHFLHVATSVISRLYVRKPN